jgi:hypothetical protein
MINEYTKILNINNFSYKNHPCLIWTYTSLNNYLWLCDLTIKLCAEYKYRYNKIHKIEKEKCIEIFLNNMPEIPNIGFTLPVQIMPKQYKTSDKITDIIEVMISYRHYYFFEKNKILEWNNRPIPKYIIEIENIFKNNYEFENNKKYIIEKSYKELYNIMKFWHKMYDLKYNAGKMRSTRGTDIENFVKNIIQMFANLYNINVKAITGSTDKKILSLIKNNKIIKKEHQVDIHIYKNDIFIAVIECKSYLDSCYYVRSCDDFKLFKKFGYNIKNYIFSLENAIDEETKIFTDVNSDYICDDIFYMLDGKRISTKPIYDKKYKKNINKDKLKYFINILQNILVDI